MRATAARGVRREARASFFVKPIGGSLLLLLEARADVRRLGGPTPSCIFIECGRDLLIRESRRSAESSRELALLELATSASLIMEGV